MSAAAKMGYRFSGSFLPSNNTNMQQQIDKIYMKHPPTLTPTPYLLTPTPTYSHPHPHGRAGARGGDGGDQRQAPDVQGAAVCVNSFFLSFFHLSSPL